MTRIGAGPSLRGEDSPPVAAMGNGAAVWAAARIPEWVMPSTPVVDLRPAKPVLSVLVPVRLQDRPGFALSAKPGSISRERDRRCYCHLFTI
jgi:hypothetical protein